MVEESDGNAGSTLGTGSSNSSASASVRSLAVLRSSRTRFESRLGGPAAVDVAAGSELLIAGRGVKMGGSSAVCARTETSAHIRPAKENGTRSARYIRARM